MVHETLNGVYEGLRLNYRLKCKLRCEVMVLVECTGGRIVSEPQLGLLRELNQSKH